MTLTLWGLLFFISSALGLVGDGQTVFVSVKLLNNSSFSWSPNFLLVYPDGWTDGICFNIDPYEVPISGQILIPGSVGSTYHLTMETSGALPFKAEICKFTLRITSIYTAIMTLDAVDNSTPVLCSYSGDPSNNTAVISLTNNNKE